jgi:hypothetical protein
MKWCLLLLLFINAHLWALTPNDIAYDNGPEVQTRLNKGELIEVEPGTYHISTPVVADAGSGGGLVGKSSGYRGKSASLTRFRFEGDANGKRMISIGVPKDGKRSRARGVRISDIMFEYYPGHRSQNSRSGTGVYVQSGSTMIVQRCSFFGWDIGLHFESADGTGHNCNGVRDSVFLRNNTGVKMNIAGSAAAFTPMFVERCDIRSNGLGADVTGYIINVSGCQFENNDIGGLRIGGKCAIRDSYFEHHNHNNSDPPPYNCRVTGTLSEEVNNSFNTAGGLPTIE